MLYEDNYLAHYGVKGQKWGVRRYQNDDGSLTSEGMARYGHMKDHGDNGVIKKWTLGSEMGNYAFAKWRQRRHIKNLEKARNQEGRHAKIISELRSQLESKDENGNSTLSKEERRKKEKELSYWENYDSSRKKLKEKKYETKLKAQSAANANLDAYRRHSSTGKLLAQNLTTVFRSGYRHARARGSSRLAALCEVATPIGPILRMRRDKKAYGKYIVFSEHDENIYTANAILSNEH